MAKYKIVQITDTHLTAKGDKPANNQMIDPESKLRRVFKDIIETKVNPNLIVITGDLVHEGKAHDYKHYRKLIDQAQDDIQAPIRVILGNHDQTKEFYKGYLQKKAESRYYYKGHLGKWDTYFLDTKCGNIEQGFLDKEQLKWLKNSVKNSTNSGLIFMHHPVLWAPLENMKYSILQNGYELLDVLKGTNVKAIVSGHVHFANSYMTGGILNICGDSTAYHINCTHPHNHTVYDATSYNVIDIDSEDVGFEQRLIYLGDQEINKIKVEDTGFVKKKILKKALATMK